MFLEGVRSAERRKGGGGGFWRPAETPEAEKVASDEPETPPWLPRTGGGIAD